MGGILLAILVSIVFSPLLEYSLRQIFFVSFFLAISAQGGDFIESWLKRKFKVKDSGFLLPGHGGFFDRLDGLLAAVPVYTGFIYVL